MAQLRDTLIQGSARVTDTLYANIIDTATNKVKLIEINSPESNASYTTQGINLYTNGVLKGHIGSSDLTGIYSTGNIVLRPGGGSITTDKGITVSTTAVTPYATAGQGSQVALGSTSLRWNGIYSSTGNFSDTVTIQSGGIWVQGGSAAGSDNTRMGLTSGMPDKLPYNTNKRGIFIYSNAIAFADPLNGNGNNDAGWIRHLEETANKGIFEIAVGDDNANEEIVVRRYNTSSTVGKEIKLFDASGNSSFPGVVHLTNTTASTSSATGALVVGGGIGTGAASYLTGSVHIIGSAGSNALMVRGISGCDSNGNRGDPATASDNAALYLNLNNGPIFLGGVSATATDAIYMQYTQDASSSTTGAVRIGGGLGVAKKIYAGSTISAPNFTATHAAGGGNEFKVQYSSTISYWWGVGTGNENHGLYDDKANKWIILAGAANTWSFDGNAATATKLGTATVGNAHRGIYLNAGTATALTWYPNYCTISSGNKANWPWHRIATVDTGTGQYVDKDCILFLRACFLEGPYGIIKLSVRTNNSGAGIGIKAEWIIRSRYAVDAIKIAKTGNSTGTNTTVDVYLKCSTYARSIGYLMEGSNNGWTLISSSEVDNTTTANKLTSTEVYTDANRVTYNAVVTAVDIGQVGTAHNLETYNTAGYITDQYGNFKHQRATTGDTWQWLNNAGTAKLIYVWESGNITTTGSITANGGFIGNATNVTGTVTYQHGGTGLTTLGSAGQVLKVNSSANGIEWGTVSTADEKVKVAANITTAADYPVVFANSNKSTTAAETAGLNKSGTKFYFNPSTGLLTATQVANAIWNDYAEYRKQLYTIQPGYVIKDTDSGYVIKANERLIPGAQIVSDTWGHSMGKTDECQTPVAVAGRVLAYTYRPRGQYHAGMAVCSAPGGTIDIMTREEIRDYPDAIIGIVSEIPDYEEWGSGKVKVDGRIWIKVR